MIGGLSNSREFRLEMSQIGRQIYGCLSSIAAQAFSQGLINEEVYSVTIDPSASHDDLCLDRILLSIKKLIRKDPNTIEKFIDVLYDIGPPVSFLVDDLSKRVDR